MLAENYSTKPNFLSKKPFKIYDGTYDFRKKSKFGQGAWQAVNNFSSKPRTQGSSIFFNWDSLRAKLKSHHEAWSY